MENAAVILQYGAIAFSAVVFTVRLVWKNMKTNFNAPPDRLPPAKNLKFSDTDSPHCIFAEIFLVLTEKKS